MPETMLAAVKAKPAPGCELMDVAIPAPVDNEVLIKVVRTSVCGTDRHIYTWDEWAQGRIKPPLVFGHEGCGEIVAVGPGVRSMKVGDFVSAETHIPCGFCFQCRTGNQHICSHLTILGVDVDGVFAQYAKFPETVCWKNPPDMNPDHASILEPFGNACYTVMESQVSAKEILITGDGPIAAFAAGIARAVGATKIIVTGLVDFLLEICKQMGADYVINVGREKDPKAFIMDHTGGEGVDVVLEMSGAQAAINLGFNVLKKAGTFTAFGISTQDVISWPMNNGVVFKGAKILGINGRKMFETWYQSRNLLMAGRVDPSPVITNRFALKEIDAALKSIFLEGRRASKVTIDPWG
ncbi:MAG: alcohol dehydrogenase catalytic domain-containing protein [bacterium]|jgi:threonine 3-dehydrogenase